MRFLACCAVILHGVSALWISQARNSSGLVKRQDPIFSGSKEAFGNTPDGVSKMELLEDSLPDVWNLAGNILQTFDDDIFERWFPAADKAKVVDVFSAIVQITVDIPETILPWQGADVMKYFTITSEDFKAGTDDDKCDFGADAYTQNQPPDAAHEGYPWALAYFCGASYDENQAPALEDPVCSDFLLADPSTGKSSYRIVDDMDGIYATVLHEMMHFNAIGKAAGLTEPDPQTGALILDIGGDGQINPQKATGHPWWSYLLQQQSPDKSILNADNYVWFALETWFTQKCSSELASQGGRFNPPVEQDDDDDASTSS